MLVANWKTAIEIVSFPIERGGSFHIVMLLLVYWRAIVDTVCCAKWHLVEVIIQLAAFKKEGDHEFQLM